MTWKPSRADRRAKQAKRSRRKEPPCELRSDHWLRRHEAEREEAEEAMARRMSEDDGHV